MKQRRKRILIADLDPEILIAIEKALEDEGYDTSTAWTGRDVLRLAQAQAFDLFLLGDHLPDTECDDILEALRQSATRVPCIVMQPGCAATENASVRLQGVCEVVDKYEYSSIVRVVARWVGGAEAALAAEAA